MAKLKSLKEQNMSRPRKTLVTFALFLLKDQSKLQLELIGVICIAQSLLVMNQCETQYLCNTFTIHPLNVRLNFSMCHYLPPIPDILIRPTSHCNIPAPHNVTRLALMPFVTIQENCQPHLCYYHQKNQSKLQLELLESLIQFILTWQKTNAGLCTYATPSQFTHSKWWDLTFQDVTEY